MGDTKTVRIRAVKKPIKAELPPAIGLEDSHLKVRKTKAVPKIRIVKDAAQQADAENIAQAIKEIRNDDIAHTVWEVKMEERINNGIGRIVEELKVMDENDPDDPDKRIKMSDAQIKALRARAWQVAREECATPVETGFMMHAASLLLNPLPGTELKITHVSYQQDPKTAEVIEIANVNVEARSIDELKRQARLLSKALPDRVTYGIKEFGSMCEVLIYPEEKTHAQALNWCPRPEEASLMYNECIKLLKPLPGKEFAVNIDCHSGTIIFENVKMDPLDLAALRSSTAIFEKRYGEGHIYLVEFDYDAGTVTCTQQ